MEDEWGNRGRWVRTTGDSFSCCVPRLSGFPHERRHEHPHWMEKITLLTRNFRATVTGGSGNICRTVIVQLEDTWMEKITPSRCVPLSWKALTVYTDSDPFIYYADPRARPTDINGPPAARLKTNGRNGGPFIGFFFSSAIFHTTTGATFSNPGASQTTIFTYAK